MATKWHVGAYQSSLPNWSDLWRQQICVNAATLQKKALLWLMWMPPGLSGIHASCLCSQTSAIHRLETVKCSMSCKMMLIHSNGTTLSLKHLAVATLKQWLTQNKFCQVPSRSGRSLGLHWKNWGQKHLEWKINIFFCELAWCLHVSYIKSKRRPSKNPAAKKSNTTLKIICKWNIRNGFHKIKTEILKDTSMFTKLGSKESDDYC